MLQLYPRNQIDFNWNGEPIRHTYDEHVVRNDGWYLSFKVLLDEEKEYKKLKKGMVVKGWTMDGEQAFRIWDITKGHGFLEIEALHLIYDLDTKMTNPVHVNNGALNSALTQFKSGLPSEMGPFTFSTGISKQRTYNTENVDRANDKYNAMDVFMDGAHSIVGTWEAELLINNWDIRLAESVGTRTGALLYEKKNIAEFEDVESNKNIITRIYAQSTYTPEREEGADDEPQEVHLSVVVESPLINDYEQVHEAIYINNDARTNQELSQWAMRKFTYEKVDLPERTIKVSTNIIDGTEIKYGDYLVLKYLTHDVEEEIRCAGYDVNPVTKDIYEINLGTNKLSMQGSIGGTVQDLTESQLNNEMAKVAERVTKVVMSSNGFNRIAYGPEPVPNPIEGDLWYEYQFDTPNTVTLKIWKDGMWVILLDDFMQERLKEKMEEVETQAEELSKGIEASDQKADQALADAGLAKSASESAEAIAQQAQAEAESANTNSSEALEKAILAGIDAETAKQNALDAVNQASTAKQNASDALGKAGEAVTKANDAISKANQIPQDIQDEIESKGLVSGSWVESHVDDVTGEINYALTEVSGSIPKVILGVEWDKSENPVLTRTDYVEEYANLTDYLLKTNAIDFSIDGLDGRMSSVETDKLDGTEFTRFKTNDYDVTVDGFKTALTDKLDTETFDAFKTHDFDVTVKGINGSIEDLQTDKLDSTDFSTFKSNDYEVTVDGLRMDLTSLSGDIPNIVMGVRWDKSENPKLYRTDDTGGVDDYEYSQQTAQFVSDISGLSGRVESVETKKLGANEFNSFKTNTYDVDLSGLRTNITSLDENKLGSDEFSNFKTNVFDVSVDGMSTDISNLQKNKLDDTEFESFKTNTFDVSVSGLSGRIGDVETEKLDSKTYNSFKTNTYDVDVSGLKTRMTTVEDEKLDSGTFSTFRDTTYSNTIEGINGGISTLEDNKLDGNEFDTFKKNEYELTVDGLRMGLTDVQGAFPTVVLGVEWDKSSDHKLTRTDFSKDSNPNLYAPSFIMGVSWDKTSEPTLLRSDYTADSVGVDEYEIFKGDYEFNKKGWEATNTYITDNKTEINSLISNAQGWQNTISYVDDNKTKFNSTIAQVDSYVQTIGSDGGKISQMVMTDDSFQSIVADINSKVPDFVVGVEWDKSESPKLLRTGAMENYASTRFAQLDDSFIMSISDATGIKTAINATTDGIRLASSLIHLSGTSLIDDAVIKSAMIDTLDATKITTGTLNARNVKVIGLDANSISGNEASFIRALFSGNLSTLQITSDGVNILDNSGKSSTYLDSSGIEFTRKGINLGKLEYVNNLSDSGDFNNMHGFSMRPNRNSYFGVSYFPTSTATTSIRRFAVSGKTGNVYISGLIKPSESQVYGLDIAWGTITGRGTNVRIYNHDRSGGIQINNGDFAYLTANGWRSLNDRL